MNGLKEDISPKSIGEVVKKFKPMPNSTFKVAMMIIIADIFLVIEVLAVEDWRVFILKQWRTEMNRIGTTAMVRTNNIVSRFVLSVFS